MKWRFLSILFIVAGMSVMLSPSEATTVEKNYKGCAVVKNGKCPDQKYIKFHLYTRSNRNRSQIITLEPDNLSSTNFKTGNPTKIIIHGTNTNFTTKPFYTYFKNQYLLKGDNNVIIVDYAKLVLGEQCIYQAEDNSPHVADCVAGFIQQLRSVGVTDIHLIGSSLGAQISGLTANHLSPYRLPRITGLDAAGQSYQILPNDQRLDAGDAIFVEALHSNGDENGFAAPLGHVDYYFNDGTHQPGCEMANDTSNCSHERAIWYYAESLTSAEGFWGWHCSNFTQYYAGQCKKKKSHSIMLVGNTKNRGIVSVPTASKFPFALGK